MGKIGNSSMDRHNARAKEYEENKRIFEDAGTAYVNEKGASESSLEAARRAARANRYRGAKIRVGQHPYSLDD